MQLFSADAIVFKKNLYDPQNMKKLPSKVAHNPPPICFYLLAWLPKRPRNSNPVPPNPPNAGLGIKTGVCTILQTFSYSYI